MPGRRAVEGRPDIYRHNRKVPPLMTRAARWQTFQNAGLFVAITGNFTGSRMTKTKFARATALLVVGLFAATSAPAAERISNPVAEFTGIDKITGRIITFDVYINETVQFGALQVTPR